METNKTISQQLAEQAGIKPRLQLGIKTENGVKSTGPHRVKYLADRIIKGVDYHTREEREEVEFIFQENGTDYIYEVPVKDPKTKKPHYFWVKMATYEYGQEVILEMRKRGAINYISIDPVGHDEIPI